MIGIIQTVNSHRSSMEEHEQLSARFRKQTKADVENLTASLDKFKTETQTVLADLRAQLDAEKHKISTQASEQQKLFADAQELRSNTFNDTVLKIQENLTRTITDQQGQFSSAQENRSREFTTAQTESQKRFGDLIADYTKRLTDQDAEFTRQRDAFLATAQSQLGALNETYEQGAKKILEQVNNHRNDVEKLVGVIGTPLNPRSTASAPGAARA